ncbi:ATP-binding protein [Streptomyces europaeiscabiei]|uniref:ATP-binding protein n=1 Tax=Streptomyces europaeiscabiei TaxID=146819 RepID=UPI0029AB384A|nr:ATP-binding protein [Streptomyces europaeiscabiei]MDX3583458.1 ATP-binding protein [Streptomyces europaeiscabiei]
MARRDPERTKYGFTVAAAVDAVPAARRQVIVLAQDLGFLLSDQTLENVELLASEVIANAVLHSDAPCDVAVTRTDERLRVEVTDAAACLPSVVAAGPDDESGRGLLLVNALADAWGTRSEAAGKTTWFEIAPESSVERAGNKGVDVPPSPHTDDADVRRPECHARPSSSADSRLSLGAASVGKRHQAA